MLKSIMRSMPRLHSDQEGDHKCKHMTLGINGSFLISSFSYAQVLRGLCLGYTVIKKLTISVST